MTATGPASIRQTPPLLEVSDLVVSFRTGGGWLGRGRAVVRAVEGVSFTLERGRTLGLVGETGSGKTTVARAVMRLLEPDAGCIRLDGVDLIRVDGGALRTSRRRFQMVFQDPYASLDPRMTVARIVQESLDVHAVGRPSDRAETVRRLLEEVGLGAAVAGRYPHEFSGGQRQRIGIARALALGPELIVADEPISALDVSIRAQILALLRRIQDQHGVALLVIAHDLTAVRRIAHTVAVMYLGSIVEEAPVRDLFSAPRHPYTVALLSAVPIADPGIQRLRRRIILVGDIPSPLDPPSGCRFHTRCWLYTRLGRPETCRTVSPVSRELGPGHRVACHFADQVGEESGRLASSLAGPPAPSTPPKD